MRKSKFSDQQIIEILKEAEAGAPVTDLCRRVEIGGVQDLSHFESCVGALVEWASDRELSINRVDVNCIECGDDTNACGVVAVTASRSWLNL